MLGYADEDGISYVLTWHSLLDVRSCRKCRDLNNYRWYDVDIWDGILHHPLYGAVWDMAADRSLAHGRGSWHCRCELDVQVECDFSRIKEYATYMDFLGRVI